MTDSSLWPLVVYFVAILTMVIAILGLSSIVGQRSPLKSNNPAVPDPATGEPFESGIVHVGSAQSTITVEFYLIALFFVIFDLETVFIFAWAVAFEELGLFGFVAISIFILILVVALAYEWKSGALDWGMKNRSKATARRSETYLLSPAEDQ